MILIQNRFLSNQKNRLTLYDALFNQTSECVVLMELDGRILEVNRKFEELHGWKSEEIVGQRMPIVAGKGEESVLSLLNRVAKGYEISGRDYRIVEAHNGTLSFRSRLQEGTTVEMVFPNTWE